MKVLSITLRSIGVSLAVGTLAIAPMISHAQPTTTPQTPPQNQQETPINPAPGVGQGQFVPLTSLPGLDDIQGQGQSDLAGFFNQLYRILIGVAAVLAVLQIMRAGFKYMTSSASVSGNKEAKDLIQESLLGLLLVLSPVIVFGIINPDILRLSLDLSALQPREVEPLQDSVTDPGSGNFTGPNQVLWSSNGDRQQAAQRCQASSGFIYYECAGPGRTNIRSVSASQQCAQNETNWNICSAGQGAPMNPQECSAKYRNFTRVPNDRPETCNFAAGVVAVPNGCCGADTPSGVSCCAIPTERSSFLIAYSFTRPATANRAACYVTGLERHSTQEACRAALRTVNDQVRSGALTGGQPPQNFTFQRECQIGPAAYEVTPPSGLNRCP